LSTQPPANSGWKVLLAIDSSAASKNVVDEAAARPWPKQTVFSALHVVDFHNFARFPLLIEEAKRQAAALVREAAEKLIRAGHPCEFETTVGSPRNAITECARQWRANLIMAGSHGQGAVARFLLGSVAQGILRTTPCSVEIVRTKVPGSPVSSHAMKLLLAVDGSEFSMAAAKSVSNRPWPTGSQIKIISVEELPVFENQSTAFPLAAVYPASLLEELLESGRAQVKEAVAKARKVLETSSLAIAAANGELPIGDAKSAVLEEALKWNADLIVLGSHGRRGLDRVLLGSVSEAVAMHAACSVEVVRPEGTDASRRGT
jgi:nucleotide-binding universal stress UspA family protein